VVVQRLCLLLHLFQSFAHFHHGRLGFDYIGETDRSKYVTMEQSLRM
jgi:hypothetical protein